MRTTLWERRLKNRYHSQAENVNRAKRTKKHQAAIADSREHQNMQIGRKLANQETTLKAKRQTPKPHRSTCGNLHNQPPRPNPTTNNLSLSVQPALKLENSQITKRSKPLSLQVDVVYVGIFTTTHREKRNHG
jgi:hypothetical protein